MANGGQVRFGIGFNVDKTSLNQLRTELQQIANLTNKSVSLKGMANIKSDLVSVRQTALAVDQALEAAFNQQLGTVNVSKFNAELKKSGLTMKTVHTDLSKIGTKGQQAFRNLSTQVLTTNRQLKQTHNTLDKMATTMGNTLKWGATSSIMNGFTGGVRKAYSYVKKLDSSLNDIRIVTEKSAAEMDKFAEKASKAAKSLAASTTDYTDAALIYYQQGLKDKEVEARANTTLKAANVTGQTGQEVSEQLTAVWNGYKVSAEETELYVDKLAAVAATTASDLQELSTGMEKVASAANAMGVDIDQLNGHLSTVISVTRQAPESVGTAFKTIYARLGDLAVGGEDEFGVKLGDVSSKLQKMGIEILDQNGNMREMGTVMEEVAAKWDNWTSSQRQAAAVAMAGKRQYNNLIALFDNWDMYTEAVETSANAMGTLQNQQDIYMESADAHVKIMKTSFEDLYDSLLNEDAIITVTDEITKIVEKMTSFVDAIGGGGNALLAFGSIATRVFSKNIAQGLAITIANMQAVKYNTSQVKAEFEVLQQFKDIPISGALKEIVGWKQQILNLGKTVTNEQNNEANAIMKERNELELLQEEWIESKTAAEQYYKNATKGVTDGAGNKLNFSAAKNNPYGDGDITEDYTKGKEAIEKAITQTQKYQQQADKASNALSRLEKIQKSSTASTEDVKKAQRSVSSSMGHVLKNAKALTAQFPEMSQEMKKQIADYSKLSKGQKQAFGNTEFLNKYKAYLISLGNEGKKALETLEKESKEFGATLGQQIEDCKRKWNNFTQSLKVTHFIKGLVTVTSAVGNLASAYQSLSNISKIANDESLSASEKTTQIIMAVSMGISMLSMGISGLSEGLIGMGTALGITTGFVELEGAAAARAGLKNKGYEISLFGVKVAAETTTGAIIKLVASFAPLLAIVGVLGGALYLAIKNMDKEAKAAEKASKKADELAKAYERTKEELGKLNEEIQTLKDNKDALRALEKGTEAWNEKLKESNEYVLELLDKYPELAEHIYSDESGQLHISDKGLNELEDRKEEEVDDARAASVGANIGKNSAQGAANVAEVKSELRLALSDDQMNSLVEMISLKGADNVELKDIANALGADEASAKIIMEDLPKITSLVAENNALAKSSEIQGKELAEAIGQKAGASKEEISSPGLQNTITTEYEKEFQTNRQAYDNVTTSKQDIIDEYLKLNPDLQLVNKNGLSKKKAVTLKGTDGDDFTVTIDSMIDAIASNNAMDAVAEKWDKVADKLLGITESKEGKETNGNLGEAILSGGNNREFDLDALSSGDIVKLAEKNKDKKLTAKDLGISNDTAISAGYTGDNAAEQYAKDFLQEIERQAEILAPKPSQVEGPDVASQMVAEYSDEELIDVYSKIKSGEYSEENMGVTEDQAKAFGYESSKAMFEAFKKGIEEDAQAIAEGRERTAGQFDENWEKDRNGELEFGDSSYSDKETEKILAEGDFTEKQFNQEQKEIYKSNKEDFIADTSESTGQSAEEISEVIEVLEKKNKAIQEGKDFTEELTEEELNLLAANGDLEKSYNNYVDEIDDVTTAHFEMNDGFQDVLDNYDKWNAGLKKKGTKEYADTLDDMRKAMGKILNVSPELISDTMLTAENLELMKKAAENDTKALGELRRQAAEQYLVTLDLDKTQLETGKQFVNTWAAEINSLKVGATFDNTKFLNGLWQMKKETGMSIGQVNELLSQMGLEPKIGFVEREFTFPGIKIFGKRLFEGKKFTFKVPSVTAKKKSSESTAEPPVGMDSEGEASTPVETDNTGGGGGGDSDPEELDEVEIDIDKYKRVNSELDRISNTLDKLADAQDRLYGSALLKNLKAQTKELKKQVTWNQKKLEIAKKEKSSLQKKLKGFGVEFDSEGDMTNANSVLKAQQKSVNEKITEYNKMSKDEQDSSAGKALKQDIEDQKEVIEDLEEYIEDYETVVYDTIPEAQQAIQEAAYEQIELKIQAFKIEGQLYLDMSEALEQLKDFKQQMNEYLTYDELGIGYTEDGTDLALGGGSLLSEASISEKNVDANLDMLLGKVKTDKKGKPILDKDGNEVRDGLGLMGTMGNGSDSPVAALTGELNGLQSEYEKYRQDPKNYNGKFVAKDKDGNVMKDKDGNVIFDEAGFREAMQETSANLEEEIAKVEEAYKENREALLNSIDLIGESYAQQMETYDFINDRIESQIEAAKLLGPKDGWKDTSADNPDRQANMEANASYNKYEGLQTYYEQASANAQAKADTAKEQMQLAYDNMNDESLSAEEREKWKAMYEESVAEYEDASFVAIEAYKAENENYVRAQADAAFGTDAELDLANAQWDIQTKLDDKYLDDIDKAYETQKLSRKLQQDMDGASLAAQQKLAKFRDEELEKLKEKDKLTQYDVDRANKLYEIELKKIALEEAQQNKSKMRLRRDSSGNYSYQFVADEDKTAEAEQALEDAQYGLREMDLEHQRELQEEMLEMQKEYKEKWIEYQLLSEEEQKAREAEYSAYFEYYQGELTNMSAQALETQDNLKESSFEVAKTLYSEDETNFKDLTDAQKEALRDKTKEFKDLTEEEKKAITEEGTGLMPTWNTAVTTMIDKFSGEGEDTFESKIKKAQGNVTIKQEELNGKITAAATGIQTAAQTAQDEATKKWLPAQKKVNEKLKTMNTRLSNANKYLKKQKEWWNKIKEEAQKAIEKTQTYLALTSKEEADKTGGKNTGGKNNTGGNTGGGSGKGTQGNGKVNKGDKVKLTGKLAESSYESPTLEPLKKYKGAQLYVQEINKGAKSPYHLGTSKDFDDEDTWVGWVNKAQISGYATGGYTGGGWSSRDKDQGKLAFLHEKELILNASDTANMLEMIRIVRDLFGKTSSLTSKEEKQSNLEQQIQDAQEAYKRAWAEYNALSAEDRSANAAEFQAVANHLAELTRAEEESKAARQLAYENSVAQLEESRMSVRASMEIAKQIQATAEKNDGRITSQDVLASFEQVLSNQNKAFSNREIESQNKIVESMNMTLDRVIESMNANLQHSFDATNQMMNMFREGQDRKEEKTPEQNVYINAEFPNASKVEDIEKALHNLVNRASQKANSTRKKR